MTCCSSTCRKVTFISFAFIFVILGVVLIALWGLIYSALVNNELQLTNSSTSYKMWKETPIPIYFEIYLFNWTNANEVLHDWNVKPKVQERGPYTFSEHHIRVNLQWNENKTVTYQQKRIWKFLPEKSNGSLDDHIITVNPIAATVGYFIRDKNFFARKAIDLLLQENEHSLAIERTVRQLLFDGYEDDLLKLAKKLNISGLNIPFDKFGWFYQRNESATYDGTFNMYTGADNILKLGEIDRWNGQPVTNYYPGNCGLVKGTSGELWPPKISSPTVDMFVPDTCSFITISYNDTKEILGLEGRVYVGRENVFDNGTKYPEMKCFSNVNQTVPSGVRDVSKCKFGAPAFVSYPHFYLADQSYRDKIDGMTPNREKHELHIILEPETGIPLSVKAQLQLNLFIDRIKDVTMFEKVKPTFMPMLWFRQSALLTPDLANQAKMLLTLPSVFQYTGYGMIGLGVLFLAIAALMHFRKEWKDTDTEELITEESSG